MMGCSPLCLKQRLPAAFRQQHTVFYFAFSFYFVFSFYSPRDACTSALVAPDALWALQQISINTTESRASIMPCRAYGLACLL
jgi:hypothetical protein